MVDILVYLRDWVPLAQIALHISDISTPPTCVQARDPMTDLQLQETQVGEDRQTRRGDHDLGMRLVYDSTSMQPQTESSLAL